MRNVAFILILLLVTPIIEPKVEDIYTVSPDETSLEITVQAYRDVNIKCSKWMSPPENHEIVWKKKSPGSSRWEKIKPGDNIQNCTTEGQNNCANSNILSILTLVNITSDEEGKYGCFTKLKSDERSVGKTNIKVGYVPDEPILTSYEDGCVFYWKTKDLKCCWNSGRPTNMKTTYEMTYMYDDVSRKANCTKNSMSIVCCEIPDDKLFALIMLRLNAMNLFGNSTSAENQVVPSKHVKTRAPTNLQLQAISNEMIDYKVSWKKPRNSYFNEYEYRLRYSPISESDWKIINGIHETHYNLEDLRSDLEYIVEVSSKLDDKSGVFGGVWSQWSKPASILTNLTAPWRRFRITTWNATVSIAKQNAIQLNWLPYDNENEDGFYNEIICGECSGKKETYKVRRNTHIIFYTSTNDVCCSGRYCNRVGCSEKDEKRISITNVSDSIPDVSISSLNSIKLAIKWSPLSPQESKDSNLCFIRICIRDREFDVKRKFVSSQNNSCGIEDFQTFQIVNVSCAAGLLNLLKNWNPCFEYSVTFERLLGNIIVQSRPSNIISYDPATVNMSDFAVKSNFSSHHSRLMIKWSTRIECDHMHPVLYFQPVSGSECRQNISRCKKYFHDVVSCGSTSATLSENVYGDTTYEVTMYMVCEKRDEIYNKNPYRSKVFGTTVLTTTEIRAPMPPREPTVNRSASEVILSWLSPIHKNGQTSYEIITQKGMYESSSQITNSLNATVDLLCPSQNNSTRISFAINAFNKHNDTILRSENVTIDDEPCRQPNDASEISIYMSLIIGICVGIVLLFPIIFMIYYHRKKIRLKMKAMWWPDMPTPKVFHGSTSPREESTRRDAPTIKNSSDWVSTDISTHFRNSEHTVEYSAINSTSTSSSTRDIYPSSFNLPNDQPPDLFHGNNSRGNVPNGGSAFSSISKQYVKVGQEEDRLSTLSSNKSSLVDLENDKEYVSETNLNNNTENRVLSAPIDQDISNNVEYVLEALNPQATTENSLHHSTGDFNATEEYNATESYNNSDYKAIWESSGTNDDSLSTNYEQCEENLLSDYIQDGTDQNDIEIMSCSSGIVEDINTSETLETGLKKFLQDCVPLTAEVDFNQSSTMELKTKNPSLNLSDENLCEDVPYVDLETTSLISSQ